MATSTFDRLNAEPLQTNFPFWAPSEYEGVSRNEIGDLTFSTSAARAGARAVIIAIGLEAVGALGVYAVWQLCHLLR